MRIGLRSVTPEDREYLWWLHRETMRDYVDQTWGWDDAWQRSKFDENFDPGPLQMIEANGESVGYIQVRRPGNEIFLVAIEIAPAHQSRGIATQFIRDLLEESDQTRLSVRLFVLKVNPARRLYERLGFRCTSETATHFEMKREPSLSH